MVTADRQQALLSAIIEMQTLRTFPELTGFDNRNRPAWPSDPYAGARGQSTDDWSNNGVLLLFPFPTAVTMRLIGVTEGQKKVGNFAAWLLTQEIETKVETTDDGKVEVWVKEEDYFKAALGQYEEFLKNPDDPKYAAAVTEANQILREKEKKRREIQKKQMKVPRSSGGMGAPTGPMTKTVMILCLLVAILTNFGDKEQWDQGVFRALQFLAVDQPQSLAFEEAYLNDRDAIGLRLASLQRGEIWRLVTPMFIHYSIFHFLFNMLWFLQFGRMIEGRYGTVWMVILVVATATLSNFAQGVAPERLGGSAPNFPSGILISSFGGLSGVVYGLFGFIVVKQFSDPRSGFFLPQLTIVLLLGWMVFCMLPVSESMGYHVANWAHAVGFLSGVVLAYLKY